MTRTARATALLLVLAAAAAAPPGTAQPVLPEVHVIATGGTIAAREGDGPLSVEQLVGAVPGLDGVARISVEQFSNIGSSQITPAHWLALARRIVAVFAERPALSGVVVTHGTDTMEETALFLHLTVADARPVVLTGAMRPPTAVAPEGAANLLAAVRVAADAGARRYGTLVVMNDAVFSAADVAKTHTSRLDAFTAPAAGPVGVVDGAAIVLHGAPAGPPARFDVSGFDELPRVDIAYVWAGADGAAIDAFAAAGAAGIVVASVGRGNLPRDVRAAALRAAERGVVVVVSSRTGAGRVPPGPPPDAPFVGAGGLNPQRARVVLMLALTRTRTPAGIAPLFAAF